ncbi:MAG: E3 ubiquitin-protein ligase ipaH9.8 [Chlamydiales bacterium]|nr:E3 ubiquitin-protein ligase ipaH9.8 [Chlamydiales bacterium]
MNRLKKISLIGNQLTTVPKNFCDLTRLTKLNLFANKLKAVPENIGNLYQLKHLNLGGNELEALPENIGNLRQLERFNLSINKLKRLPESIGNLTKLTDLGLHANKLKALPVGIGSLRKLPILNLSKNKLKRLPENIGSQTKLMSLCLEENKLEGLPASIGNLTRLEELSLSNNPRLVGLPDTVLNLPENCRVELTDTGLSEAILQRLQEASAVEGYQGPRFSYSIRERIQGNDKSLQELLNGMYTLLEKEVPTFPGLDQRIDINILTAWLNRISYIGDYNAGKNTKKVLVEKTVSFIEKAYADEQFADVFKGVIDGAADTCGDRMALSIVHLGLAHQLSQIDSSDLSKLGEFLVNTVWAIEILEECARNKILSLRFFDEIEVYLGYIIKLQNRLKLSIAVDDMLYFRCSSLTEEDLSIAANRVEEKLASDEKYDYLIKNEKWIAALRGQFSVEIEQIDQARYADYKNNPEDSELNYKAALIKLSRQAL